MKDRIFLCKVCDAAVETGTSVSEYYSRAVRGVVPPPLKIGIKASRVPSHEIAAVVAARIAGRSEEEIKALVANMVADRANIDVGA